MLSRERMIWSRRQRAAWEGWGRRRWWWWRANTLTSGSMAMSGRCTVFIFQGLVFFSHLWSHQLSFLPNVSFLCLIIIPMARLNGMLTRLVSTRAPLSFQSLLSQTILRLQRRWGKSYWSSSSMTVKASTQWPSSGEGPVRVCSIRGSGIKSKIDLTWGVSRGEENNFHAPRSPPSLTWPCP